METLWHLNILNVASATGLVFLYHENYFQKHIERGHVTKCFPAKNLRTRFYAFCVRSVQQNDQKQIHVIING